MARTPRKIVAGQPYELILRVSDKLPFIPSVLINLLIQSVIARVQRDFKVIICHCVWMGNHVHFIIIPFDPQQCVNFYQEVQKKLTEAFKRLTGIEKLNLWDGAPVLAQILDIDKVIEKIAYIYANPAKANLVETISEYPGVNTYNKLIEAENTTEYSTTEEFPWIRVNTIDKLVSLKLKPQRDKEYANKLKDKAKYNYMLTIEPNAWMKSFGITEEDEIREINERIIIRLKEMEQDARDGRVLENKTVIGAAQLKKFPILEKCNSKKREKRIFVLSSIAELRIAFLREFKEFVNECRRCYELLKNGVLVEWPPGAFRPPAPPLASALA